jgi:hypothetical protein
VETRQIDLNEDAKEFFRQYYRRMSVLVTQIPHEVRAILLPRYLLFGHFKAVLHLDTTGRLALEMTRRRSSRISIRPHESSQRVESLVLGKLGEKNLFLIQGRNTVLKGLVLTHADFVSRFRQKVPDGTVLNFGLSGDVGPINIGQEADAKLVDVLICWLVDGKPFIKDIPFAWLMGNAGLLNENDPSATADSDFYSSLFSSIQYVITSGYEKLGPDTKRKTYEVYSAFLTRVERELKNSFRLTAADERTFHQLLEKYRFFMYPQAISIESEVSIDGYKADFCIRIDSHDIVFVEIEPPQCKPFIASSASARLEGALQQVRSWKEVNENKEDFGDKRVNYWILIGLLEDMTEGEKTSLERFNKGAADTTIRTYDQIIGNVQFTKRLLDKLKE